MIGNRPPLSASFFNMQFANNGKSFKHSGKISCPSGACSLHFSRYVASICAQRAFTASRTSLGDLSRKKYSAEKKVNKIVELQMLQHETNEFPL